MTGTDEQDTAARLAALERELERLKPEAKNAAELAMGPLLSPAARANWMAQEAARHRREEAIRRIAEQNELDRRAHEPALRRHERQLASMDADIQQAREALDRAERELVDLQVRRRALAERPPWTPAPEALPSMPIQVGPNPARDVRVGNTFDDKSRRARWLKGRSSL
jgi:hypothetical protein